jgi:protocatechuate 3,4-dioxygenase beta subunit
MVSSTRRAITCILVVLVAAVYLQAQTSAEKVVSGSISGKVTIKGKPAVRVMVIANDVREGRSSNTSRYRARTDQAGSYRITNLAAGTYEISTVTPALVPANQLGPVVVSEGEQVEDVDVSLVPGGAITGKITDSEGEPVIGQAVRITPLDNRSPSGFSSTLTTRLYIDNRTDDRGVYRAFGLPAGKYKVSVGESGSGTRSSQEYYKETFYPSVSDAAKATVIEVTEGSEANNIDIVLGRPIGTFRVTGRLVDGETGRPVPNISYSVGQTIKHDQHTIGSSSSTVGETNANGEFRLENVTPGRYTIFTTPATGSEMQAASLTVEVVDRDLTDLLIKTTKGSSLSGVVVLEGNERTPAMLSGLHIHAWVAGPERHFANATSSAVGRDGTFSINGVRSGLASFGVSSSGDNRNQFEVLRVERNGIPSETINVKEREHVAGIRVVVKYLKLTGAIRGQVKVENGELPPVSRLSLWLWPLDENFEMKRTSSIESPKLDARGRFFAERLPAGTYRLSVNVMAPDEGAPGRTRIVEEKTQQVTVTDDTVTEVTLILKLQSKAN